jgi:hypothetical protein
MSHAGNLYEADRLPQAGTTFLSSTALAGPALGRLRIAPRSHQTIQLNVQLWVGLAQTLAATARLAQPRTHFKIGACLLGPPTRPALCVSCSVTSPWRRSPHSHHPNHRHALQSPPNAAALAHPTPMQATGTSIRSALSRIQPAFRFRTHSLQLIKLFMRESLLAHWPIQPAKVFELRCFRGGGY